MTLLHARVDKLLVGISQKRVQQGFIAEEILTFANVKQSSGLIGKYGTGHLRIEHDIVGGNTPYPRITTITKESDTYLITNHGLSDTITEADFANEEQPFDARKDTTETLTDKLQLGKEKSLADSLTNLSVITQNTTLSGTAQFDDYSNSDPIGVFRVARAAVRTGSGQIVDGPAGFAVVPWEVVNVLKYHPAMIDLVKYVSNKANGLTNEELGSALGVGRLLVAEAQYNTAKEGQTDNITAVWGKNIIFGYAPKTGTKKIKTLGFRLQQKSPRRVFTNKIDNPPNGEEILVDDSYAFVLTDVLAAYLVKDVIA